MLKRKEVNTKNKLRKSTFYFGYPLLSINVNNATVMETYSGGLILFMTDKILS